MTGTVALVVLSYNRPRMLREALGSIDGAAEVFIADDGSDFHVDGLAAEFGIAPDCVLHGDAMTPAERVRHSNCGALINAAIRRAQSDYVALLCDDDVMAPGWLEAAAKALDDDRGSHMVRGTWRQFEDGQRLSESKPAWLQFDFELTTGNFVYRRPCADLCKCPWPEGSATCHDALFLQNYLGRHGAKDIRHVGVLAGYRREHRTNMIRWTRPDNRRLVPEAATLFAGGMLDSTV